MSISNKPIQEQTTSELLDRKKKHQFWVGLIDEELRRRENKTAGGVSTTTAKTTKKIIIKSNKPSNNNNSNNDNNKNNKKYNFTKNDMIEVLKKRNIVFKSTLNKQELIDLVVNKRLVSAVESHKKSKN